MIKTLSEQKDNINKLILGAINEILYKGLRVTDKTLGSLEDDISLFMRALQIKNKIYDFAVSINYNEIISRYEGKIIYSLVNTENMGNDASTYEDEINFNF